MDHIRRSFPLPSTKDQRIRSQLLAAEEDAVTQQLDRMNSFLGHIGHDINEKRKFGFSGSFIVFIVI